MTKFSKIVAALVLASTVATSTASAEMQARTSESASANSTEQSSELQTLATELERDMKELADKLQREIDDQGPAPDPSGLEFTVGAQFEIKWEHKRFSFDLPTAKMQLQTLKFDLPEVRMETKTFSWHVPAIRMVRKEIGKKPEFHHFKVVWTPIYANMPEGYMKRMEVKFDIPRFNTRRHTIKMHIPVFTMERHSFSMHIPQFYLKDVDAELSEYEAAITQKAEAGQKRGLELERSFGAKAKVLMEKQIETKFEGVINSLGTKRVDISASFEKGIGMLQSSIDSLRSSKQAAEVPRLESELSKLRKQYADTMATIDASVAGIERQRAEALKKIAAQFI